MKNKKLKILLLTPILLFGCSIQGSSSSENSTSNETNSIQDVTSSISQSVTNSLSSEKEDNESTSKDLSSNETSSSSSSSQNETSSSSSSSKNNVSSSSSSSSSQNQPSEKGFDDVEVITTHGGEYPADLSNAIYLAPNGNDNNVGSKDAPLFSLQVAVNKAQPGTVIILKQGTYSYSSTINISKSGTKEKPIYIQAENYSEVILDYKNQPYGFNKGGWGIKLTGNYWKIQGITIQYAGDNAIKVEGSHNYIGRCVTHHNGDTGIQLGFGHTDKNPEGELCAYNTVENCDSYLNYDYDNHQDADGFACKMHPGKGNVFKGCRAWYNCDDAWDLYETDHRVTLIDCWALHTAKKEHFNDFDQDYLKKNNVKIGSMGNGNGIKLGGNGTGGSSKGQNLVKNCVAFGCDITGSVKGFDENNHTDGNIVENCVAWDNGYNYMFENGTPTNSLFKNCISFRTPNGIQKENKNQIEFEKKSKLVNCNFDYNAKGDAAITFKITKDDFITIAVEDAIAKRESDGSLPNNGFARLRPTSEAYAKGLGLK